MRMLKQVAGVVLALDLLMLHGCGSGGDNSNGGSSSSGNTGTLQCTLLATGSVFSPGFNDGFIYQIAIDASNVYWYDVNTSNNTGTIKSVSKNGGPVTSLASGLGGVHDFTIDDTSIYWTEHNLGTGAGSIKSVPKAGGAVVVLASGTPAGSTFDVFGPNGIALDSTFVYWGEAVGGGAVRRVPKAGGPVIDINRGQGSIDTLALDSPTTPTTIIYSSGSVGGGHFFSIPIAGAYRSPWQATLAPTSSLVSSLTAPPCLGPKSLIPAECFLSRLSAGIRHILQATSNSRPPLQRMVPFSTTRAI